MTVKSKKIYDLYAGNQAKSSLNHALLMNYLTQYYLIVKIHETFQSRDPNIRDLFTFVVPFPKPVMWEDKGTENNGQDQGAVSDHTVCCEGGKTTPADAATGWESGEQEGGRKGRRLKSSFSTSNDVNGIFLKDFPLSHPEQ